MIPGDALTFPYPDGLHLQIVYEGLALGNLTVSFYKPLRKDTFVELPKDA